MGKFPNPLSPTRQATTKKPGVARFATSTEVTSSNNVDVMISPNNIQSAVQSLAAASTTTTGVIEIATDAEALAKTATDKALVPSNLAQEGFLQYADVTLTSAEVKALAATQITLVAAQGANTLIKFMGAVLKLNYGGSNAFTESSITFAVKYTDDTGVQVSQAIEATGWIDQTADTYTTAEPKIDAIVAASAGENKPLVLDNLGAGEVAGNAANDNTVTIRVFYQVMSI